MTMESMEMEIAEKIEKMDANIVALIEKKFAELQKQILLSSKAVLNVKELAMFTGLSVGYIYNLVSAKKIPHYKTDGGKLTFFKKSEVENWLCAQSVPTYKELEKKRKKKL